MFVRELLESVHALKGAGPAVCKKLAKLGIFTVADILLYPPRDYEDRTVRRLIACHAEGPVNCEVIITAHEWFGFGRMKTLKLHAQDLSGSRAVLVCFNRPFMENGFPEGSRANLFGRLEYKYGELQSAAFELEAIVADPDSSQGSFRTGTLPVYPLTEGISQGVLRKLSERALANWGKVDDEIPAQFIAARKLAGKTQALKDLHHPATPADAAQARRALAYEELFYLQIMILKRSIERRKDGLQRKAVDISLAKVLEARLPFTLTADQEKTLEEIATDMASPWPMARLLQGDVGSGKTLVAFMAALFAVAGGGQAALLAPTELLARQHADNAARLLEPLGIRLAYLSGNVSDSSRKPLLSALARGDIDIAVGTHALFSADVVYKNLRFVIVDEQHRFGVLQRIALGAKGNKPDMLMMSATPIPRTLALTAFGDLSVSTIRTMPEGRKEIITHLARQGNEERVYDFVRRELKAGNRAYFVYPLVENSDKLELKNAEAMFSHLQKTVFPEYAGGLIHSRLPEERKRDTMSAFSCGVIRFLVATSVVEVGVDVPEATCMVIEHAERFGLAALHQLRGRVGRSSRQSYCFLVWSEKLGDDAKRRVMAMKETTDGFKISEEDLRIRGPGDITGTSQAGALRLTFCDPVRDAELLEAAREDAGALLREDPELQSIAGSLVRSVLERASPFAEKTAGTG